MAVDTLGHLLALQMTPTDVGDREVVGRLAADIQDATGDAVVLACVDQGYTGDRAAEAAADEGSGSKSLNSLKPSVALCSCPDGGLWNGPSPGPRVAVAWSKITSDTLPPLPGSMSSPSSYTDQFGSGIFLTIVCSHW
jgi:hypothetical protein